VEKVCKKHFFTKVLHNFSALTVWFRNFLAKGNCCKSYRKDILNHLVFLSLSCVYKTVCISYSGKETRTKLCISDAKLRSGIRDLEQNKHQLLHRIQSLWTSLIYNKAANKMLVKLPTGVWPKFAPTAKSIRDLFRLIFQIHWKTLNIITVNVIICC